MIPDRLIKLRKEAGLTQQKLADILHVKKHSISAYERGHNEPPDDIKIMIARHFGVSIDYLLGITDDPVPKYADHENTYISLPNSVPEQVMQTFLDFKDFLKEKYSKDDTGSKPTTNIDSSTNCI